MSKCLSLLFLIDILIFVAVTTLFAGFFNISYSQSILPLTIFLLTSLYILYLKDFYSAKTFSFLKDSYFLFEGVFLSFVITFIIMYATGADKSTFYLLVSSLFLVSFCLIIWHALFFKAIRVLSPSKNVLIIGAKEEGEKISQELSQKAELKFNIIGFVDNDFSKSSMVSGYKVLGTLSDIEEILKANNINLIIDTTNELEFNKDNVKFDSVEVFKSCNIIEKLNKKIPVESITEQWFENNFKNIKKPIYEFLCRIFDIVAALIILLVTLPFEIIIALSIKLADGGSIFYFQERVGKDGQIFNMIKLRTMIETAEKDGAVWACNNNKDPRVTPIGKIARKIRFDEIPQMINIIKGEMSIVGPRPERPEFVEMLKKEVPFYEKRHCVKPGWTGWAQIKYRYGASVEDAAEKLRYDIFYIKHRNLFWDLSILLKAVGMAITGRHG